MKAYIIVPYRDREQHKNMFVPYLEHYLQRNLANKFEIVLVEQDAGKPFNRAKLLNVGVDIARSDETINNAEKYYVFHDIDMLPTEDGDAYDQPGSQIVHIATEVEQFGYNLPYNQYIGGVTLLRDLEFQLINGYCNDYWGWGAEDDDLYIRMISKNLSLVRRKQNFKSLAHAQNGDTNGGAPSAETINNRKILASKTVENVCTTGFDTLKYTKLNEEQISNFTKIYKVII